MADDNLQPDTANPSLPFGSVDNLYADSEAILREAPTLDAGYEALQESYTGHEWNQPEVARDIIQKYGDALRNRFRDESTFSNSELASILPTRFSDTKGEAPTGISKLLGQATAVLTNPLSGVEAALGGGEVPGASTEQLTKLDQVNKWEAANIEGVKTSSDPDMVTFQDKIIKSLNGTASEMRKQINTSGQNAIGDVGYRFLEGFAQAPLRAAGTLPDAWGSKYPRDYLEYLQEHTKEAQGDDFAAYMATGIKDLASGGGTVAGITAATVPYLALQAYGSTVNQWQEAFERSGDKSQAWKSATIEGVNQAIQVTLLPRILGSKAVTPTANTILSRLRAGLNTGAKEAAQFAGLNAVGNAATNAANNVASGRPFGEELTKGTGRALASGAVLGGVLGGVRGYTSQAPGGGPERQIPPDTEFMGGIEEEISLDSETGQPVPQAQRQIEGPPELLALPAPEGDFFVGAGSEGAVSTQGLTQHEFRPQDLKYLPNPYDDPTFLLQGPRGKSVTENGQFNVNRAGRYTKAAGRDQGFVTLKGTIVGEPIDTFGTDNNVYADSIPSFETSDGNTFIVTQDGNTKRISKNKSGRTVYQPLDKTFYVDTQTAAELAESRFHEQDSPDHFFITTDGKDLQAIQTDENGKPTAKTVVPSSDTPAEGLHRVAVNQIKNDTGNAQQYQSHISTPITKVNEGSGNGDSTAGAADIGAFGKERATGERFRTAKGLSPELRELFGTSEKGFNRYFPDTMVSMKNKAGEVIGEMGLDNATQRYLDADPYTLSREDRALGIELTQRYAKAYKDALASGDTIAAEKIGYLFDQVGQQAIAAGGEAGFQLRQQQELSNFLNGGRFKASKLKASLKNEAVKEIAKEEGVTEDELNGIDGAIKKQAEVVSAQESAEKGNLKEGETKEDSAILKSHKQELEFLQKRKERVQKAQAEKLKNFDPEAEAKYTKLNDALLSTEDPNLQAKLREAITDIETKSKAGNKQEKIKNTTVGWAKDTAKSLWGGDLRSFIASNLLGVGSIIKKASADAIALVLTPTTYIGSGNFEAGRTFLKEAIKGFYDYNEKHPAEAIKNSQFWNGLMQTLATGDSSKFKGGDFLKSNFAKGEISKNPLRLTGIIPRTLAAITEGFYRVNRTAQAKAIAADVLKRGGGTEEVRAKIAESLYEAPKAWDRATAKVEETSKVLEETTGKGLSPREKRLASWDLMHSELPTDIQQQADWVGQKNTLINTPVGAFRHIYDILSLIKKFPVVLGKEEVQPLTYPLMFMRVGLNLLSYSFDATPVGLWRATEAQEYTGRDLQGKKTYRDKARLENAQQLFMGVAGTALMGGLLAKAWGNLDQDFPDFMIHGEGHPKWQVKSQMVSAGWIPESVQIGSKYYSFKDTLLSVPLGILGQVLDTYRYNKDLDPEDFTQQISVASMAMLGPITNLSMFKSVGDFFEAVSNSKNDAQYSLGKVTELLTSPAKGLIPFYGTQKFFETNPIDTHKNMFSKFMAGTAFAPAIGETRPSLNYFGDPISKSVSDRLGAVWGIGYGKSDASEVSPEWQWLAQNNYTLPQNQNITIHPVSPDSEDKYKDKLEERSQNLGPHFANILTTDERYQLISEAGPKMKAAVGEFMARYGNSGHDPEVQKNLKERLSKIWGDTKRELFAQ